MKTKLKQIMRKHGMNVFITMIAADILDELILPAILLLAGHPALSGMAILADIDWLTYPIIFFTIKKVTKHFTEVGA